MKPATEILLSAAFALTPEENWFGMGQPNCGDDRICMSVAIEYAVDELCPTEKEMRWFDACVAASLAIGHARPSQIWDSLRALYNFNDTHTHAEVLDALYRAAEIAESGHGV